MPKKPINWRLWTKVAIAGLVFGVGGPMLTAWVSPSEEEIRAKYNPDLRRRSIEGKAAREQEFDEFVTKLKEYSKSDKPIWIVQKEEEERNRKRAIEAAKAKEREAEARRDQMRKEAGLTSKSDAALGSDNKAASANMKEISKQDGSQQGGWLRWLGWK